MTGWWHFTRSAVNALTTRPDDVEATDRAVRDLASDSRLGVALHRASRLVRHSWAASRACVAASAVAGALAPESLVLTFRLRGWIAVVAGAVVFGLYAIKPVSVGPLSSLVPALAIAGGVLLMLIAAPVARASADRRSRHKAS